jgi:replicative DNA helicase
VTDPGPFHRAPQPWMNDEDDGEIPHIHPAVIASDQVTTAMNALDRHPDTFMRWPFAELDAMTGPMAPGNVWFVCAASGGGKTTFVASIIDRWRLSSKRVYVMPLETRAHEFRTYLACMATEIHPGDVLSGEFARHPNYRAQREVLKSEFFAQAKSPYVDCVMVSEQRAINLAGLQAGLREAKAFNADVVIVDHIDHISGGDGKNLYAEAKAVNDGALRMAQDNDLLLLFTSQLNMSASKGDYLTKYLPPKTEHIAFGSLKQRNATGMIGLFRPLRKQRPDESEDDYVKSLRAARSGSGSITEALSRTRWASSR